MSAFGRTVMNMCSLSWLHFAPFSQVACESLFSSADLQVFCCRAIDPSDDENLSVNPPSYLDEDTQFNHYILSDGRSPRVFSLHQQSTRGQSVFCTSCVKTYMLRAPSRDFGVLTITVLKTDASRMLVSPVASLVGQFPL